MKVTIIGGGGVVGSTAAFALQCGAVVSEICLVDVNQDLARGQATDLLHGSSLVADQHIYSGELSEIRNSHIVIVTAGLRRKPDESRLDLVHRNVDLFLNILKEACQIGWHSQAILLVVSNPVDILTYLAVRHAGLPAEHIIGLGTLLDTARFRSYIAAKLNVAPTQVDGWVLGEHGDSMVPVWSSVRISGWPVQDWPGYSPQLEREVNELTKKAGAEMIRLKGASAFAVGLSIREVVHAIALDQRRILPVSTWQQGKYGLRDVCLSIPTRIGCGGMREQLEIPLTPRELAQLQHSAQVLRETIQQVEARLAKQPNLATKQEITKSPMSQADSKEEPVPQSDGRPRVRTIPRSAWQLAKS
ncbi:MAG: lactate/malate dehydrogenase family protein [Gemmatales bacterium]|nr:lactate/malate dehydrogenase family protein [Gemmatales bacterium]